MSWFDRFRKSAREPKLEIGEPSATTALDLPAKAMSDYERNIVSDVREYGWFCTHVGGDETQPSFTYTTGFWLTAGVPEMIVFGLPGEAAHGIFWDIFRSAKAGSFPPVGQPVDGIAAGLRLTFTPVSSGNAHEWLLSSKWFYRNREFPCLQLVWPDESDCFPWDPDFDERFRPDQPDLSDTGWSASVVN